jgi:hypothetical protein
MMFVLLMSTFQAHMAVLHLFLCCRSNLEDREYKIPVKLRSTSREDKAAWSCFPETDKRSRKRTKHMKLNSSLTMTLEHMVVDLCLEKDKYYQQDIAGKNLNWISTMCLEGKE